MFALLPVSALPLLAILQTSSASPLATSHRVSDEVAKTLRIDVTKVPPPQLESAELANLRSYFVSPVQGNPRAIADDGTFLYLTNFNNQGDPPTDRDKIYKVDRLNGQLAATIVHNLGYLGALAYDCSDGTFWGGDYNTGANQTVYHFDANWQLLSSFDTPEVEIDFGGIDGLAVVGDEIWVSGDLAVRVHRYTKDGTYLGVAVEFRSSGNSGYRNSGLAFDGTDLWGVFTDWGFVAKYPPQGPPWSGFYTGYYWNYKDQYPGNPASGFLEDLEFSCGDPSLLWAHGLRFDTGQSVVLRYDVTSDDQRAGSDCDVWFQHRSAHGSCAPAPAAIGRESRKTPGPFRTVGPAGIPNPAFCTVDPCLVTCPFGDFTFNVIVREGSGNPMPGSVVTLSFEGCPSFSVCPVGGPYTVNQSARTITVLTGPTGLASFPLRMGGVCGNVRVTADGITLATRPMASTDQNGDLLINAADLAVLLSKPAGDPTGDLDCDGATSCPVTGIADDFVAGRFYLGAVWPNPMRGSDMTTMVVEVPVISDLRLELFDLSGRRLADRTIRSLPRGQHRLQWRIPEGIPPGMYSVRISDGQGGEGRKQLIVLGP